MSLRLGVVCDNLDPLELRRVKVQSVNRGVSSSDWLSRITQFSGLDSPVPNVGDSVIIASVDGDSNQDIILGVLTSETTNKPLDKDQIKDHQAELINQKYANIFRQIELLSSLAEVEIREDGGVRLSNQFGSIYLTPTGYTILTYPGGSISLGSSGFSINSPLPITINAPELTWNGQRVSRVGGLDSRGDTTLS